MSGPMLDEATQKELEKQMLNMLPPEARLPDGFEDPSVRAQKQERKEKQHLFRQKKLKETNRRKEKNRRKANKSRRHG